MISDKYILITAARNEESYISFTLSSIISQSIRPQRWVIVSDGSTDRTDEIVQNYASRHRFILLIRRETENTKPDFASKVKALHHGYEYVKDLEHNFVGHLDADISLSADYYEHILHRFSQNEKLAIAGGFVAEPSKGGYGFRLFNAVHSVAGGIQLFRREFYEAIGGLIPLEMGGEDWYAEVMARMQGWEVKAFPELIVLHHKTSSSTRGRYTESFREGLMDFSLGSHPLFEIMKCFRRMKQQPILLAGCIRMAGFLSCYLNGKRKRQVPDEFVAYLRREQLARVRFQAFPTMSRQENLPPEP